MVMAKERADEYRVSLLLDDIGVEDEETRMAAATFGAMLLDELPEVEDSDLQNNVACFCHGYELHQNMN